MTEEIPIPEFAYHRPRTLEEAGRLAAELEGGAIFLAGGTEILPDQRRGAERARHLISLRDVPDLDGIADEDGGLRIGAMTRLADVAGSPLVRERLPALAEAAGAIGGAQVRGQGTIGGNFCRAVSCADTPPPAIAAEASVRLVRGAESRDVRAQDFFTGPRATVRAPEEVLVAVRFPPPPPGSGAFYARFALRRGQALAVASVAARVVLEGDEVREARIALGAVAPFPFLAREASAAFAGGPSTEERLAAAAAKAAREADPIDDVRGSAEYRRELVAVLTARALRGATERARGGPGR